MERIKRTQEPHASADTAQKRATSGSSKVDEGIGNSARQLAQRQRLDTLFGDAAQRKDGHGADSQKPTTQRQSTEGVQQAKATDAPTVQQREASTPGNRTGLPDPLKGGIEALSGMSMDHVKVHYNSSRPAQLNALAYAQGSDIHLASGQEKHLPHEAWHVVQQAQGRVQPTMQAAGVGINDDAGLEREADRMGQQALQRVVQPRQGSAASVMPGGETAPVQRLISVQDVDYDPVADQYRHGNIDQDAFYVQLRNVLNAAPFQQGHRDIRAQVCQAVRNHDYQRTDIEALTAAIATAVTNEYGSQGRPIVGAAMQEALAEGIRAALVGNIQANHALDMDHDERTGYDALRQRPGVVMSRAKGVANQIAYGNLPAGVSTGVTARLAELRAERAALSAAALSTRDCFVGAFAAGVCARQRALRYQGNHTNNAGWLPAVVAPADAVSAAANAMAAAASPALAQILNDVNGPTLLAAGTQEASALRQEFRALRAAHFQLNDAQVRDSALAALCQGVSAYIEFSLSTSISRMMYEPVNRRVYVTAHYKWREGFNPFFQVTGFPAI